MHSNECDDTKFLETIIKKCWLVQNLFRYRRRKRNDKKSKQSEFFEDLLFQILVYLNFTFFMLPYQVRRTKVEKLIIYFHKYNVI